MIPQRTCARWAAALTKTFIAVATQTCHKMNARGESTMRWGQAPPRRMINNERVNYKNTSHSLEVAVVTTVVVGLDCRVR